MQKTAVKEKNDTTVRRTIKSVIMDELMKEMQALNEQREAEIRSLRTKCYGQEEMISAIKKILGDELQKDFNAYKQSAAVKIKTLEDSLAQTQKTVETLTQERKTIEDGYKQLQAKLLDAQNQSTKERKSAETKLQKKIDSLEKELANERTRCNKLEDTLSRLENKPKEKLDANGALNLKQFLPNTATIDLVKDAVNTSNGTNALPKISLTPITLLTQGPTSKKRKS